MPKLLNTLIIATLLLLKPLLKRLRWQVLFVTNSGTEGTLFWTLPATVQKLTAHLFFKTHHSPIGFIKTPHGYSLVVSNTSTNDELWTNSAIVAKQIETLPDWHAKRIALGGILPSAIAKFELSTNIDPRVNLSTNGAVFMISQCMQEAIARFPELLLDKRPISIIGSGYTGQALAKYLEAKNIRVNLFDIVNKDIFPHSNNVKFMHQKFQEISSSGLLVLLTTKGDDGIRSIEPHLLPNMVLLSDTYPKVSAEQLKLLRRKGVSYFECHAKLDGIVMFPTYDYMPYNLLGGCFIQSYVESVCGTKIEDFDDFERKATALGLTGFIRAPSNEGGC